MHKSITFTKAQALGNDFVIVEESPCVGDTLSQTAKRLADRRLGIGCDQVIFYTIPSPNNFTIRFFNADGSEAEACGNGTRAFALFANTILKTSSIIIKTKVATFSCDVSPLDDSKAHVGVILPEGNILPMNRILADDLSFFFENRLRKSFIVDVGNPHLVLFLDDYTKQEVTDIGSQLTHHPFFKRGVNVGFVKMPPHIYGTVINFPGNDENQKNTKNDDVEKIVDILSLNVYERGVGPTPACGTGAFATYLAAKEFLNTSPMMTIRQEGGDLNFQKQDTIYKVTGDASLVFQGVFYL